MLLTLLGTGAPPTPVPGISIFWIKDNSTWRLASVYFKESGSWEAVKPYIKVSGDWK